MKHLTVGVCFLDDDNNIITKRTIGTNWTINVEQDLKGKFNKYMMDEVASVLTENLKLQLTNKVMKEMLTEVHEREN